MSTSSDALRVFATAVVAAAWCSTGATLTARADSTQAFVETFDRAVARYAYDPADDIGCGAFVSPAWRAGGYASKGCLLIDEIACGTPVDEAGARAQYVRWFVANPGLKVVGERSGGYICLSGERARMDVSVRRPAAAIPVRLTGDVRRMSGDGRSPKGATITAALDSEHEYGARFDPNVDGTGYYEVHWTVSSGPVTGGQLRTSLAVIPDNPQAPKRHDSPFGINGHRWRQADLLPVARRIGVAWMGERDVLPRLSSED